MSNVKLSETLLSIEERPYYFHQEKIISNDNSTFKKIVVQQLKGIRISSCETYNRKYIMIPLPSVPDKEYITKKNCMKNINLLPLKIERETYSTLKRRPNPVKIQQDFYILGTFPHEE